jgi:hypothetical protein
MSWYNIDVMMNIGHRGGDMTTEATLDGSDVKTLPKSTAVYIPFKTFLTAVTSFAQALPIKLDRSAWPSLSNLLQGQTLNAFKFLGLTDKDGYVQPMLKQLASEKLESAQFKSVLAEILKAKYRNIAALASQHGTIAQLQETMRQYNVSGTTLDRAIRFWTEAAKFSGVQFPPNWRKTRGASIGSSRRRKGTQTGTPEESGANTRTAPNIGYLKTVKLHGGIGTVTLSVSVNPIELRGKDRVWFYELVDKLNECPLDTAPDKE